MKFLVVHGPNINLTGTREPEVYGHETLEQIDHQLVERGHEHGIEVRTFQSNHEGALIDALHDARLWASGVVLNPGALAHYSYALRDAVAAIAIPVVEVHMSQTFTREPFRHASVIAPVCRGQILGFGTLSYVLGLDAVIQIASARA